MRKIGYSTLLFLLLSLPVLAQNGGINFQGMARNAAGEALANQKISLRLSVLLNSESGTVEYSETKEATTSGQGIFSVVVGDGNILTKTGNFSDINWKNSLKFLKVELDPSGGSNFALLGTSKLQAVPFAYYANGVDAENIQGTLAVAKGGTGVASITALKNSLGLDQVNNTADANKPLSTATQTALNTKVDKITGKELSSNDFTTAEKTKLAAISGTNTGDQDLSGFATTTALAAKANTADITTALSGKVDKITGKELSSNDFTTAEKTKLAAITGTNTGDQDLSGLATTAALGTKANTADVTTGLAGKVDKVTGKELSTNDYTTAEKNKLAAITGANTGDQDLSGYATTAALAAKANISDVTTSLTLKANTADVTTALSGKVDKVMGKELSSNDYSTAEKTKLAAITGTNTGDQDLSGYATTAALAAKANISDVTTSLTLKANTADVTTALSGKVDKVPGKELSSNDYSTTEKTKLAAITGTNTGDQTSITGNAGTATKLASQKTINGVAFDGSTDITITAAAETLTGTNLNGTVTGSSLTSVGNITSGSWNGNSIAVNKGGTGQTSFSDGQLLIGNSTGNTLTKATITAGTGIAITNGAGSITIANTSVPLGTTSGDMLIWDGTSWVKLDAGRDGQTLTFIAGKPRWTGSLPANTVVSPTTGKIWMDRNLGASQVATSENDPLSFGDLYQWGRGPDGHQLRSSSVVQINVSITNSFSSAGNQFISPIGVSQGNALINDWRNPSNENLWQGVNGINNPCPDGYRLPTYQEWTGEFESWITNNGFLDSVLKLPKAGTRSKDGVLHSEGVTGIYWSSTTGTASRAVAIVFEGLNSTIPRNLGCSVRCIKD